MSAGAQTLPLEDCLIFFLKRSENSFFYLKKKLKILSSNIFKHQNPTTLPSSPNLQTSPPPFFSSSLPPPPPLLPKPPPPPPLLPHPPPPLLPPRHSPTAVCLSPFSLSLFCACRCVPPSRGVGRPFDRQRGGCECCRASEREGCLTRTEPSGGSYSGHRSSVGEGTRILQSVCTPTKGLHTYLYVKILVIC
ncbi:hypothetical protein HanIR_Chr05g0234151 [Helianthus annuus]|nr:hypothetical protein HanIR_Chr05g0234151 [Helianthus annuus]